jgi:SPP1 gp7 family putative phage head morphogenesis protein
LDENELKKKSSASDKQAASISINWELANTAAIEWARLYGSELVRDLTETTLLRLQEEIANFIERGDMTIPQLRDQLIPLFGEKRADLIATTEVTRAFAEGNLTAWKETGFTEGKEWVTANDELVCPICRPLDGEVVAIDADFSGGHHSPPAHPRCRCGVNPVPILDMGDEE